MIILCKLICDLFGQVVSLLELVKRCSSQHPEIAALFYDELANVMCGSGGLDPKVQVGILGLDKLPYTLMTVL